MHKLGGFDNVSEALAAPVPLLSRFTDGILVLGQIESGSVWKQVYQDLGIPILNSAAGYNVKCAYRKYADTLGTPPFVLRHFGSGLNAFPCRYLYGFEEYCTSTAITFRMDLPLRQGAKGEVKAEADAGVAAAASSGSEAPADAACALCKVSALIQGRTRRLPLLSIDLWLYVLAQDEKPEAVECVPLGTEGEDSGNGEEAGPLKADADEGSSTAPPGAEGVKQEYGEEHESKNSSG